MTKNALCMDLLIEIDVSLTDNILTYHECSIFSNVSTNFLTGEIPEGGALSSFRIES
jgi:hypothetical protein